MNTLLIVETTPLGIFVECRSCGACEYSEKKITHRRRCTTPSVQYDASQVYAGTAAAAAEVAKPVVASSALSVHAANVRRTGLTLGRDAETYEAVRAGHLSMSDAMNTDD